MNIPIKRQPKLITTDRDIAWLLHYARTTSEGDHPFFGNYIADVIDALVSVHEAIDTEQEYNAAEALVDAATALRDNADRKMEASEGAI